MELYGLPSADCRRTRLPHAYRSRTLGIASRSPLAIWCIVKFEAKYETQRKVTSGAVETLIALDIASNQKVIVHIFECLNRVIAPRTEQELLNSFAGFGIEPAAMVIDAGTVDGTSLGYLVTTWPGDRGLDEWLRCYQRKFPSTSTDRPSSEDRQPDGSVRTVVQPSEHSPGPSGGVSGVFQRGEDFFATTPRGDLSKTIREFTREFSSVSDDDPRKAGQRSAVQASAHEDPPPRGDTRKALVEVADDRSQQQIGSGALASGSAEAEPPAPKVSAAMMESVEAGQFTKLFFKDIEPKEPVASPSVEGPDGVRAALTGEFTSFFRSPFSGERPAEPRKIAVDAAPRERVVGEFTKVFGSSEVAAPASHLPSHGSSFPHAEPVQSSTEVFEPRNPVRPSEPIGNGRQPEQTIERSISEVAAEPRGQKPDVVSPQGAAGRPLEDPRPPAGGEFVRSAKPAGSFSDMPSNATRVFSRPEPGPSLDQPVGPTKPSAWTEFRSKGKAAPVPVEEPLAPPASGQSGWGNIPASIPGASVPSVPSMQPPAVPLPASPPVPLSVQAPTIPTPPVVPVAPPQPVPAPKGISAYLPLIIVLNVLFILAALLVLYFALKH